MVTGIVVSVRHVAYGNFKEFYACRVPRQAGSHKATLEYNTDGGFGPREREGDEVHFFVSGDLSRVAMGDSEEEARLRYAEGYSEAVRVCGDKFKVRFD